jgi:hypothetical protein
MIDLWSHLFRADAPGPRPADAETIALRRRCDVLCALFAGAISQGKAAELLGVGFYELMDEIRGATRRVLEEVDGR